MQKDTESTDRQTDKGSTERETRRKTSSQREKCSVGVKQLTDVPSPSLWCGGCPLSVY